MTSDANAKSELDEAIGILRYELKHATKALRNGCSVNEWGAANWALRYFSRAIERVEALQKQKGGA